MKTKILTVRCNTCGTEKLEVEIIKIDKQSMLVLSCPNNECRKVQMNKMGQELTSTTFPILASYDITGQEQEVDIYPSELRKN